MQICCEQNCLGSADELLPICIICENPKFPIEIVILTWFCGHVKLHYIKQATRSSMVCSRSCQRLVQGLQASLARLSATYLVAFPRLNRNLISWKSLLIPCNQQWCYYIHLWCLRHIMWICYLAVSCNDHIQPAILVNRDQGLLDGWKTRNKCKY